MRNVQCLINPILGLARALGVLRCTYTHGIYSSFWHFWHFSFHLTCLNSFSFFWHFICHSSLLEVAVDCPNARDWCFASGFLRFVCAHKMLKEIVALPILVLLF